MIEHKLSNKQIYIMAKEGYRYELSLLTQIIKSDLFAEILPFFTNYRQFVLNGRDQYFGHSLIQELMNNHEINCSDQLEAGKKLFTCANLSASCEIFGGWIMPIAELDEGRIDQYLEMAISHGSAAQSNIGNSMAVRLNNGDTVRVIQTLKLLGLLPADTSKYKQLSLGASIGKRDSHAFHLIPAIASALPGFLPTPLSSLKFGVMPSQPSSIILIDSDPSLSTVYEKINNEGNKQTIAMNMDFYDGMDRLHDLINHSQLDAREMISAFRLAPEAFPDVNRFFQSLSRIIDESAHFVTTIGAGENLEEFEHRRDVMNNLFGYLIEKGMEPVRIKNYTGSSMAQQRENPLFGLSQYASYETLYCKLDKSKL
jgi:hypothetical protein